MAPNIDYAKRDALLRKYCPEMFEAESEPAPVHGKLRVESGEELEVLLFRSNNTGEPTEGLMLVGNKISAIQMDREGVREAMLALRQEPPETDSVIFDAYAIEQIAGRPVFSELLGALMSGDYHRFRGLNPTEVAALLRSDRGGREPSDQRQQVETLSLEEFFDGNGDDSSIDPNDVGYGHPGIAVFRDTLMAVRNVPGVLDRRIGVHEWPYPDEEQWISAEDAYIWVRDGEVDLETLETRIAPLRPDGFGDVTADRLFKGLPEAGQGTRVYAVMWD